MFYFAIPLRAKATTDNWNNVCHRLECTIKSLGVSGNNYKIVIAGHDKPSFLDDHKEVTFLSVSLSVPSDKSKYMSDKESKKNVARIHILKIAKPNDLFMFLDADDILSNEFQSEITSKFDSNPDIDDIAIYSGFAYDVNRGKLAYLNGKDKIFYRNCGSSFISRINKYEIEESEEKNTFLYLLKDHTTFPEHSIRFGRSILALFTPVVCYVVCHGSNDTSERLGSDQISKFVDQYECKDDDLKNSFSGKFDISLMAISK